MSWILIIVIVIGTFLTMELITWYVHRYIMHGFLWFLHKDHHTRGPWFIEKNDAFFLIFALPAWLCIMLGVMYKSELSMAIGSGITLYGLTYFMVHEVIIHQRLKLFTRTNNTYILAIRRAHKMHHRNTDKNNGESFGLLWIPKKYRIKIREDKKRIAK